MRLHRHRSHLNAGLVISHRSSGKVVGPKLEARILEFLVSEDP